MKIPFWLSISLHILIVLVAIFGADISWLFYTPKLPPTAIPVEFVPISKESQGAISKPTIVEKEEDKDKEKSEPKTETKPEEKPEDKPKPIPQKAPKEEVKEDVKKEDKPKEKPQSDPDGIPKKKKDEKKKDEKKPDPKLEPKKDVKKDQNKNKKNDKKDKVDDEFDQILKNLDTKPAPVKDDKKAPSKGKKKNVTNKLSDEARMSLGDAMKRQIAQCWKLDAGIKDIETMTVVLRIKLRADGSIEDAKIIDSGRMARDFFYRSFAEGAKRAVLECAPYNLPPDMYDGEEGWKEMELNFSPQEMLDQVQ
jgi:hypothetical protein